MALPFEDLELSELLVAACELGDDAAHKLGEALTQNVSLGKLNVSRALGSLTGVTGVSLRLTQLRSFAGNSIGDFTGFSRGLAQNSTLQELIAGGNRVGEAGGEAFGEALAGNVALKRLELRSTSLGPCGTSWLASGLLTNGALRFLGLAGATSKIGGRICLNPEDHISLCPLRRVKPRGRGRGGYGESA